MNTTLMKPKYDKNNLNLGYKQTTTAQLLGFTVTTTKPSTDHWNYFKSTRLSRIVCKSGPVWSDDF